MADQFRAASWPDFVGQEDIKTRLEIHIQAAVRDKRPMDHILLAAPPGFGKTSLATIIANRLGDPILPLVCPVKPGFLAMQMQQFEGGVLFLDEVHRAPKAQQEDLLSLLEDGFLQMPSGRRIQAPWLTVIAATTEPEKVTPALYDRFPIKPDFVAYEDWEMKIIARRMATKIDLPLDDEVLTAIANASGGTPRGIKELVLAARDLLSGRETVTGEDVLSLCKRDPTGLTQTHLDYLNTLRMCGGRAGLDLISNTMRLHPGIVRETERVLLERDLIMHGDRGRELTNHGWSYGKITRVPRLTPTDA